MAAMDKQMARSILLAAALSVAHSFDAAAASDDAQDPVARAQAVLADARKAIGGEERLRTVRTVQATGDYRRSIGETQMEGELELLVEMPGKLRRNETVGMPGGGTMVRTEVLNGAEVWDDNSQRGGMGGHMMIMRGPGGRELSEEQIKDARRRMRQMELTRYVLAWLLMTDAPVSFAGIAEAPDGKADVLEITPAEGTPMRLFVDRQTRLPLMLTWKGPQLRMMVRRGPGGGPPNAEAAARSAEGDGPPPQATFEMRFEDYRMVEGIQLPHRISRGADGSVNEEWTIRRYRLNAAFKDGTFTK